MKVDISTDILKYVQKILRMNELDLISLTFHLLGELYIRVPVFESETITHVISTINDPRNRYLYSCAWITFTPQCVLSVKAVNCQQDDSVDNYNLYEVYPLTVCCFKSVPYIRAKSGQWKKIVIGIFNFREVLRPFLEPGRSAPFPGASRMIREVSHVWGQN